jgi:hypothetical protein
MPRAGLWAVVVLAAMASTLAFRARVNNGGTPPWDSASHGLQGYAVAQDVARFDVPNFTADVFGHRYRYAPGHPLLLAAAYLVFGPSWWTAIAVSTLLFGALAILLYATAESKASGWVSALLALTCPGLLALSGEIMLEIPAAILAVLALRLYARSLEDDRAVRPLGWTLTIFMLTAAQYAVCWIVILVAFETWRFREYLRGVLVRFAKSRAIFHPVHILIALCILIAIAVRVSGGWSIPLGSRTLSMTRAGGALIAAALIAGARVGWLAWKHRAALRETAPWRFRAIFMTAVVPIYVWIFVIYPPRFQQYAEWFMRPPSDQPRTDPSHWSYYPEYFVTGGHAVWTIAAAVVILAAAAFCRRGAPERIRFLRWAVVAGTALVLAHPARQTRFLIPFLPAWWILATDTLVELRPAARARLFAATMATAALFPGGMILYGVELRPTIGPPPVHREYAAALQWTINRIEGSPSVRIVGGFEGLSRHLFEWELRKRADLRKRRLGFNLDLPESWDRDREGPRKVFDRWLAAGPEEIVVALEPDDLRERPPRPLEEIRKADHDWPEFTMRFLRAEPRFEVAYERLFDKAGLRVRIYRRKS